MHDLGNPSEGCASELSTECGGEGREAVDGGNSSKPVRDWRLQHQVSGEREAPGKVSVGAVKALIREVTSRPVFPSSPALPGRHPALTTTTLLCVGLGSIFHIPAYCPDSLSSHIIKEQSSATGC